MTEPDVGPIVKNAQYVILRRLGWVSPSREHFQNFGFIVILYFDAPRGMASRGGPRAQLSISILNPRNLRLPPRPTGALLVYTYYMAQGTVLA